jgi:hypothetical protein
LYFSNISHEKTAIVPKSDREGARGLKTDSIFYKLFVMAPSVFFELIGNTDPRTSAYGFGSQEVKQTSFTIDGIFFPPLRMR